MFFYNTNRDKLAQNEKQNHEKRTKLKFEELFNLTKLKRTMLSWMITLIDLYGLI